MTISRRIGSQLSRWLAAAAIAATMWSCASSPPNVFVLLVVDTLRADYLGCYGHREAHSPVIDRLAAEGVLFENAAASVPVTLPSMTTILTGAYPTQHGVRGNGPYQLSEAWTTMAESFSQSGYATGAFMSAAVLDKQHNLTQGFDHYDDDVSMPHEVYQPDLIPLKDRHQNIERRAAITVERALAWFDENGSGDTFLVVHLFDPHVPQDPPPPFREIYEGRYYDGEIAYVDEQIGILLDGMREMQPDAAFTTVFVADHGEGLGTHEEFLHGKLLFDETVRVPLIVHGPAVTTPRRVQEVVRTADILPTMLTLAGIEQPQWCIGSRLPGIDYAGNGSVNPQVMPYAHAAYSETFVPRLAHEWCELRSIRTTEWKLVEGPRYELYDMVNDRGEMTNVADENTAVRDSLALLLDEVAFWSVRQGADAGESLELSEQQRKKLESLGYITPTRAGDATSDTLAVWYFPHESRGKVLGLADPRHKIEASFKRVLAESHYRVARSALAAGDMRKAAQNFDMAIQQWPNYTEAYIGLAHVANQKGRRSIAIEQLERGWDNLPPNPRNAEMLADAFVKIERVDYALRVIDEAIATGFADSTLVAKGEILRGVLED